MTELALDDVQRHALPSELKGVGVAQLVWCERRRLTERMFSPDGLDRDTLEHIEQLTDNES